MIDAKIVEVGGKAFVLMPAVQGRVIVNIVRQGDKLSVEAIEIDQSAFSDPIICGRITIDRKATQIAIDQEVFRLTGQQHRILLYFVSKQGKFVSNEELCRACGLASQHGIAYAASQAVSRLRLRTDYRLNSFFRNSHGRGFWFLPNGDSVKKEGKDAEVA